MGLIKKKKNAPAVSELQTFLYSLLFRGSELIWLLNNEQFDGQVKPVPLLFHDKLSRQYLGMISDLRPHKYNWNLNLYYTAFDYNLKIQASKRLQL